MTSPKSSADPVGAAMTRDEIIEQCARRLETQKSGSQVYNDICQELAGDLRSFKSLSAPPVQAITEAMVEAAAKAHDPDLFSENRSGIAMQLRSVPHYGTLESTRDYERKRLLAALEAAFRVRPAPSDDAQRPTEAAISAVAEMLKRAAPVPELLKKIEQLEAIAGGGADHLLASTLAEFKEACAKVADAYPGWEAEAIGHNIRALPIPEPWQPTHKFAEGGVPYRFIQHAEMKDIASGEWFPAVIYENAQRQTLCTTEARWFERFTPLTLPVPPAKEPTK